MCFGFVQNLFNVIAWKPLKSIVLSLSSVTIFSVMSKSCERLFFALWPDDHVRVLLDKSFSKFNKISDKARVVKAANLHLTLHFLGNVPKDKVDCFVQQAKKVNGVPFKLTLNQLGHFKKPKVVWSGCESVPDELSELHNSLAEQLKFCEYAAEHRVFTPHMTLARKFLQPLPTDAQMTPIDWIVDRFVLIQSKSSVDGVEYQVRNSFPLN